MNGPHAILAQLRKSIASQTFIKLVLSRFGKPRIAEPATTVLSHRIRLVELKRGTCLSFTARTATQETTRNLDPDEGCHEIERLLEEAWPVANLFTSTGDWTLEPRPDGSSKLTSRRASLTSVPPPEHDRAKASEPRSVLRHPVFHDLGLTTQSGDPAPSMGHKVRQISRFIERFEALRRDLPKSRTPLRIVDFGSGKAYLTFALALHLAAVQNDADLFGIELRKDLIDTCENLARKHHLERLQFLQGSLDSASSLPDISGGIVIALHACDTATDQALALGITRGADLIITSPCCHKECRPQIALPEPFQAITSQGILLERFSEMCTDTVRRLLLETQGFRSAISEFVDPEDAGKNLLLTGIRDRSNDPTRANRAMDELHSLIEVTGIKRQHLATLLSIPLTPKPCSP